MHPIARYRLAKGLTQLQLAELVGVSVNSIRSWESGILPRPRHITRLAEVLGLDQLALLDEITKWRIPMVYGKMKGVVGTVGVVSVDTEHKTLRYKTVPSKVSVAPGRRGKSFGPETEGPIADFTPAEGESWDYSDAAEN